MAERDEAPLSRRSRLTAPNEVRRPSAPGSNQDEAEARETDTPIFEGGSSEPVAHRVAAATAMADEEAGAGEPEHRPLRPNRGGSPD
ncbi:hypothetical protein [Propylenella binzhouense]|uniref:Uncharacterized protein n=1 Tax=Propylenella binzhouense TaxID=2555902 RepID=A0A964T1A6_9HYPH|nr:hypothetical protein [Propylenella binzhouense]MYZ46485.1 hypothetical protein [Propylenella binzhouense]